MASYVTFTLEDKINRLKELEKRQSFGPTSVSQQGGGVRHEFDTKDINIGQEIEKLLGAIRNDPNFDVNSPYYEEIMASARPGQTTPVFC